MRIGVDFFIFTIIIMLSMFICNNFIAAIAVIIRFVSPDNFVIVCMFMLVRFYVKFNCGSTIYFFITYACYRLPCAVSVPTRMKIYFATAIVGVCDYCVSFPLASSIEV